MLRKTKKRPGEKIVKEIKPVTLKQYSSEEKIRIVLDGLRCEDSIAELCRREGISQGVYCKWSRDFMAAAIVHQKLLSHISPFRWAHIILIGIQASKTIANSA